MRIATTSALILLVFSFSTRAQTTEDELVPQDPKAQEILDALSNKAKEYKSFSANFSYTLVNKSEGMNESQSGSVMMKGRKKYKLNIPGQQIMSDGETVWTFISGPKELQISDVPEEDDEEGNLMNPANAFHMYKKEFKYQYAGQATVDGRSAEVIKLFPMNPAKKPYHTIIVNVDYAKLELISMVVLNKDGNQFTYKLKNFKADIPVTDADFIFNEDDADDVIDYRE